VRETRKFFCKIPGEPVAKARSRTYRNKYTGKSHGVTPERTVNWEGLAAWELSKRWKLPPIDKGVVLRVTCVFKRPKRLYRKIDPDGRIPHTSKPDWDNCGKIVSDALTKAGVIRDDALVYSGKTSKYYAARDECPCVEFTLYWGDEWPDSAR
jgi:Holliday junction resolvase RusA-like endonuclease